jgi:molybdenum cofactor guanylyltransferase
VTGEPPGAALAYGTVQRSAIVLAGGRSSRFGSDKLRSTIEGRSLLEWAVARVAGVCDEVIVALPFQPLAEEVPPEGAIPVRDPVPDGGPAPALLNAARMARGERLLVVGGDMPGLVPAVLGRLLDALGEGCQAAALGLGPDDRPQPLPLAVGRSAVLALVEEIPPSAGSRARPLRSIFDRLATHVITESAWRPLDPDAASLRDVDTRADL